LYRLPNGPTESRAEENLLLAVLSADEYRDLLPHLEEVTFSSRKVIQEAGEPIRSIYFPQSSLVSLFVLAKDGTEVEVAVIGNEGLVGLSIFWGVEHTPHEAVVVLSGSAMKTSASALKNMIDAKGGRLHDVLLRYTHALVAHISQTAACNRLHEVSERLARWLLVSHDRAGVDEFPLTQEFLAQILGVRRAGVSETISAFSAKRLIACTRGRITIIDRDGLKAESCECYEIVKQALQHYLQETIRHVPRSGAMSTANFSDTGHAVGKSVGTDLHGYRKH
jgi:CRP-like cAMP-binding protein